MRETAVVTGGTGFLARHLVKRLLEKHFRVVCIVKKTKDTSKLETPSVDVVRLDLSTDDLQQAIPKGAILFHCYSLSPGAHESKGVYQVENVLATQRLLEASKDRIKKLVYVSSASVIGPEVKGNITEESIPHPDNIYGESKLQAEQLVRRFHEETKLPVLVLRLSTLFGPGMHRNSSSMKLFTLAAKPVFVMIGSGKNLFEFTYIKNVAEGIAASTEAFNEGFHLFNIADTTKHTLREVVETIKKYVNPKLRIVQMPLSIAFLFGTLGDLIAKATGRRFPLRTRTIRGLLGGWVCDVTKAKTAFGYVAPYDLETAVAETVESLREEGIL